MYRPYYKMIIEIIKDLEMSLKDDNKEAMGYSIELLKTVLRWQAETLLYDEVKYANGIYGEGKHETVIFEIKNL